MRRSGTSPRAKPSNQQVAQMPKGLWPIFCRAHLFGLGGFSWQGQGKPFALAVRRRLLPAGARGRSGFTSMCKCRGRRSALWSLKCRCGGRRTTTCGFCIFILRLQYVLSCACVCVTLGVIGMLLHLFFCFIAGGCRVFPWSASNEDTMDFLWYESGTPSCRHARNAVNLSPRRFVAFNYRNSGPLHLVFQDLGLLGRRVAPQSSQYAYP